MATYTITIVKVESETYEMELEAEGSMSALDQARSMVKERNEKCPQGTRFSVLKVIKKEENNGKQD
jgi:competence protein ComGC